MKSFKDPEDPAVAPRTVEPDSRRTEDLAGLSTYLQSAVEQEKAALARELHDEFGGLLIAARMDVSWLEERINSNDPEVRAHFKRVHEAMQAGVELKRRLVEQLRPSLLDNLGLFPALRWQVANSCGNAGLKCIEHYPDEELPFTSEAAITVFRIVQEALVNVVKHARARTVHLRIEARAPSLVIGIRDDGIGMPPAAPQALRDFGLLGMRHRVTALGGEWQLRAAAHGGTEIEMRLPLVRVLEREPALRQEPAQVQG